MPQDPGRPGAPLASGLMNHSDFELAKALGFQLFVGPFFAAPRVAVRAPGAGRRAQGLASSPGSREMRQIEDLEQIIDRDLGLSVKLLRYINSAYFGVRAEIVSIRQAVMMLGSRGVSRWALLISLAGGPSTPRELSVLALTRARMCEILGRTLGRRRRPAVHDRAAVGGRRAAGAAAGAGG